MAVKIKSKTQMYSLYENGEFGNKLRTWSGVDDFFKAGSPVDSVVLRYAGQAGGGWVGYGVPTSQIEEKIKGWTQEGAKRELFKVSENAPDERLTIQGEIMRSPYWGGLELRFSDFKGKMREAMKFAEHVWGVSALTIMRDYMTGSSYNDVEQVFDLFPDSVIEFSCYEMNLGNCPGRNTLIWEVRNY